MPLFLTAFIPQTCIWFHGARRMRRTLHIPEECGHNYWMSTLGQTLSKNFCINYLWSSLSHYTVGIISVVVWARREWGEWEIIICLGNKDYCTELGGQRIARILPEEWTKQEQPDCVLCGLWALEEDAFWLEWESRQILFSWLIGHLFIVPPHSQSQTTEKSAVSTGGTQSKTKPRAVQCY